MPERLSRLEAGPHGEYAISVKVVVQHRRSGELGVLATRTGAREAQRALGRRVGVERPVLDVRGGWLEPWECRVAYSCQAPPEEAQEPSAGAAKKPF